MDNVTLISVLQRHIEGDGDFSKVNELCNNQYFGSGQFQTGSGSPFSKKPDPDLET